MVLTQRFVPEHSSFCYHSALRCGQELPITCSDDFSLEYTWQSGSVPPPYYFEYTVIIKADGRASVTLLPDYPQHHPQPRCEEFSVSPEAIERLCELMRSCGLFDHAWKDAGHGDHTGGESASLTAQLGGQVIQVPHLLSMVDGLRFMPVYEAIRDLSAEIVERLRSAGDSQSM